MFLDVGNALRMSLLLLSQLFCRLPSNYETSINLAIMNALNLLYSYLYVPQRYIAVSFNKCTLCKSLWIKASAKCPKYKCSPSSCSGGGGYLRGQAYPVEPLAHPGHLLQGEPLASRLHPVDGAVVERMAPQEHHLTRVQEGSCTAESMGSL